MTKKPAITNDTGPRTRRGRAGFPLTDLCRPVADPNPIIDEGNPTSTAGLHSVLALCKFSGMSSKRLLSKSAYQRGWVPTGASASPLIAAWELIVQYIDYNPVALRFDVTPDDSPITLGKYVKPFSITNKVSRPTYMSL